MKNLMAATAGLALLASTPAVAAGNASSLSLSTAATATAAAQSDRALERRNRGFERYAPIAVVVIFTAVFIYFLLDAQEGDGSPISV